MLKKLLTKLLGPKNLTPKEVFSFLNHEVTDNMKVHCVVCNKNLTHSHDYFMMPVLNDTTDSTGVSEDLRVCGVTYLFSCDYHDQYEITVADGQRLIELTKQLIPHVLEPPSVTLISQKDAMTQN